MMAKIRAITRKGEYIVQSGRLSIYEKYYVIRTEVGGELHRHNSLAITTFGKCEICLPIKETEIIEEVEDSK